MKSAIIFIFFFLVIQKSFSQVWDNSYSIQLKIKEAREIVPLADSLYNSGSYAEALPHYLKIFSANPGDYESTFNLGDCYNNTGEPAKAIDFYLKSAKSPDFEIVLQSYISIASVYAIKNEKDSCFKYLNKAVDRNLRNSYLRGLVDDKSFDGIRDDKRYIDYLKKIKGEGYTGPGQGKPTSLQMQQGVRLMYSKIKEEHPFPYRHFTPKQYDAKVNALIKKAPALSPEQYFADLLEIAGMMGDVHSSVYLPASSRILKNSFGFRLWKFKDGLFVRAVTPENKKLLGARVTKINNIPVEQVIKSMMKKFPKENESMELLEATYYMHFPGLLKAAGLSQDNMRCKWSFQLKDKSEMETELLATDTAGYSKSYETCTSFDAPRGWITELTGNIELPVWLRNKSKNYSYEISEDGKCIYMQMNHPRNDPKYPWKKFIGDVFDVINRNEKIEKLVFDQRHNPGGWHYMAQDLMHAILQSPKINQPGHLYIINSRITQSAGIYFTTLLENNTYPIIVGEPAGAHPNIFNGRIGNHPQQSLPGTDISFRVSTVEAHFSDDIDDRHFIAPDIPMEMTYEEFVSGKDPLLKMAMNFPVEKGKIFFTDAGGRPIRKYFHWNRPSQEKAFHQK